MTNPTRSADLAVPRWRTWHLICQVMRRSGEIDIGLVAAGVAFFGLFALFPALAAVITLFGLLADPVVVANQLTLLQEVIPAQAYDLFSAQIDALLGAGRARLTGATILSVAVAMWSSRACVAALIRALNAAYGQKNRTSLRHVAVAMVLTVALIAVAIVSLLAVVVIPILLAAVHHFVPQVYASPILIETVRWGGALAAMLFGLGLLYRYGPNDLSRRPPWITPGAIVAIGAWFAASIGFSVYLSNFNRLNDVYGSIAAVIAVQLWIFISAYLVILGAVLNAELARLLRRRGRKGALEPQLSQERPRLPHH